MTYSCYSFARKLSQAAASGLSGALLTLAGYTTATAFDPAVTGHIFEIACAVPAIGFGLTALILGVWYPLNKKSVESNCEALAAKRKAVQD